VHVQPAQSASESRTEDVGPCARNVIELINLMQQYMSTVHRHIPNLHACFAMLRDWSAESAHDAATLDQLCFRLRASCFNKEMRTFELHTPSLTPRPRCFPLKRRTFKVHLRIPKLSRRCFDGPARSFDMAN